MPLFKVKLIPVDESQPVNEIEIVGGKTKTLADLLGCAYIETVRTREGMMVVDESGMINGRPINPRASKLYSGAPFSIHGLAVLFAYDVWEAYDLTFA